jgi:hypothetical protein
MKQILKRTRTMTKRSEQSRRRNQTRPQHAASSAFALILLDEPHLQFGVDQTDFVPKRGLTLYGPSDLGTPLHHDHVRVGLVGTGTMVAQAQEWLERCADPIAGKTGKLRQAPHFPGFNPDIAFRSEFTVHPSWRQIVTQTELSPIFDTGQSQVVRFQRAVDLFANKVQLIADRDDAPDVIICALSQEIVDTVRSIGPRDGASQRLTPLERTLQKAVQSGQLTFLDNDKLFGESKKRETRLVYRNFRRAIKARVMSWKVPVQLAQPRLFEGGTSAQDAASRAWNFCVGMYFKAGGIPWRMVEVEQGTCFVGVSFYHHVTEVSHVVHSSLAQVFTDQGEGIVLRGEKFEWDPNTQGRSPHLTEAHAKNLIEQAIEKYREYVGTYPRRVVLHKTSKYWPEELGGFQAGLAHVGQYDLVALYQTGVRFFREGQYPPLRGMLASFGDKAHFLYTLGYIPFLETYPRPHVPEPLEIVDHIGDSPIRRVCEEILALTKMNWNSAEYAGGMPITLRFARRVGEIMSEIPEDEAPQPSYRFYM